MAKHTKKKCRSVRGQRVCKSKTKRAVKGARSKTHRGEKDYTTKKGDKVFHRKGHDEKHAAKSRKVRKPFVKSKKGGWNQYCELKKQGFDIQAFRCPPYEYDQGP